MLKKILLLIIFVLSLSCNVSAKNLVSKNNISNKKVNEFGIPDIIYNNKKLTFQSETGIPFIDSANRTQIPVRAFTDFFGYKTDWNNYSKTIYIYDSNKSISLRLESNLIAGDYGKIIKMDTKPTINEGRIYVPLRYICNALGFESNYNKSVINILDTNKNFFEDLTLTNYSDQLSVIKKDTNITQKLSKGLTKEIVGFNMGEKLDYKQLLPIHTEGYPAEFYVSKNDKSKSTLLVTNGHADKHDRLIYILASNGSNFFGIKVGQDNIYNALNVLGEPSEIVLPYWIIEDDFMPLNSYCELHYDYENFFLSISLNKSNEIIAIRYNGILSELIV